MVACPEVPVKTAFNLSLVPVRSILKFDVYKGPKFVATVEGKSGYILPYNQTKLAACQKHPFIHLQMFDNVTQVSILNQLEVSASFEHFLLRLIDNGFNVSGAHQNNNSKAKNVKMEEEMLIGRAWRIVSMKKCAGFLLDTAGTFCALNWQPIQDEGLMSQEYSLTLYEKYNQLTSSKLFSQFVTMFKKAKSLEQLRNLLTISQFELEPCLY